jgi:hypothetical protein
MTSNEPPMTTTRRSARIKKSVDSSKNFLKNKVSNKKKGPNTSSEPIESLTQKKRKYVRSSLVKQPKNISESSSKEPVSSKITKSIKLSSTIISSKEIPAIVSADPEKKPNRTRQPRNIPKLATLNFPINHENKRRRFRPATIEEKYVYNK